MNYPVFALYLTKTLDSIILSCGEWVDCGVGSTVVDDLGQTCHMLLLQSVLSPICYYEVSLVVFAEMLLANYGIWWS
jgi:hypothetical protein